MSGRYFGQAADLFGLVAYWTVMYGRLPTRSMLAELYTHSLEPSRPLLTVIPGSSEPHTRNTAADLRIDEAA